MVSPLPGFAKMPIREKSGFAQRLLNLNCCGSGGLCVQGVVCREAINWSPALHHKIRPMGEENGAASDVRSTKGFFA
jgi:hypothetical protein